MCPVQFNTAERIYQAGREVMKTEALIQIELVNWLSANARRYGFFFFSIPNEGFMKSRTVGRFDVHRKFVYALLAVLKKMGLTPGVPDLCIVYQGEAYFLEVKNEDGRLTGSQPVVHERLREVGCPVCVVRTLDDMEMQLREWGIVG